MSWRNYPSLRRTIWWMIAAVAVLIAVDVFVIGLSTASQGVTAQVRRSENVQRLARDIPKMLDTLDVSDRGYFLTEDPAFLATSKTTADALRESSAQLATQAPAGTVQAEEADQLRDSILERIAQSTRLAESSPRDPALEDKIPVSTSEMREQAIGIAAAEQALNEKRQAVVRTNSGLGGLSFLLGTIFCVVTFCIAASRLAREAGELKTVQRELETSRRSLNEIVANTTSAITVNDLEGRYILANDSALVFLGKKREEVIGRSLEDVLPPSVVPGVAAMMEQTKDSQKVVEQIIENAGAGEQNTFSVVGIPMRNADGEVHAVAVVSTDVTPIRQAQLHAEAMRLLADEASKQAARANHAKTDFLSRMSHELRTPMNAILGFAQLLQAGKLTDNQQESVGHILRGGRHLLNLINDVLDISRIETQDFSLSREPIEVRPAIAEVCEMVAPIAVKRGVRVIDDTEDIDRDCVYADSQRLRQILMNLISNAIKYGPEGGEVRIRAEGDGNSLAITVRDDGEGIPPDKLDRLFTPFERLGAENSTVEGTGLGLALSRNLAEAMEGTLTYVPPPEGGSGTSFVVRLPQAASTELPDSIPPLENGEAPHEIRVLYIEDNLPNVKLMEMVFEQYPAVKLLVAMRGQTGLEMAREHRPDLILLDLHLPDMEGSEILEELKKEKRMASVPVIVVSADATEKQIKKLMAMGAEAYQTKPIQIDTFIVAVDAALAKSRQSFLPRGG